MSITARESAWDSERGTVTCVDPRGDIEATHSGGSTQWPLTAAHSGSLLPAFKGFVQRAEYSLLPLFLPLSLSLSLSGTLERCDTSPSLGGLSLCALISLKLHSLNEVTPTIPSSVSCVLSNC